MLRFRLVGVPVTIRASFFLVAVLLAAGRSDLSLVVSWVAVVLVSILAHEMGHAAAARHFGLSPVVTLYTMGGVTEYRPTTPLSHWRHILVSLAGPAAGFVLGGLVYLWRDLASADPRSIWEVVQADLLWVNVGWSALNLLPIGPLDGGHVASQLLQAGLGPRGATAARVLSLATALGLGVVAIVRGWYAGAFLLCWVFVTEWGRASAARAVAQDQALRPLATEAAEAARLGDAATALRLAREGMSRARSALVRGGFTKLLAHAALLSTDEAAASEALGAYPPGSPPPPSLYGLLLVRAGRPEEAIAPLRRALGQAQSEGDDRQERAWLIEALFCAGRFAEAARLAEKGFDRHGTPLFAYNAACCFAQEGDAAAALEWLTRAVEAGWDDAAALESDPDLDAVRALPEFGALRDRLVS